VVGSSCVHPRCFLDYLSRADFLSDPPQRVGGPRRCGGRDGTAATEAEAAGRQRRRLADGREGVIQEGLGRGCVCFLANRQVEPKHEKGLG
jgi:hypothetical protein